MSSLFANPAFVTALIGLLSTFSLLCGAAAAYLQLRVRQAAQGGKIDVLQQQVAAPSTPTTVVAVPQATVPQAHVCSACGHVDQPLDGPPPGATTLAPAPSTTTGLPSGNPPLP
jgi:hypothetical protein